MGTLFPVSTGTGTAGARGQSFQVTRSIWLTDFVTSACCGVARLHWPAGVSLRLRAWVNDIEAGNDTHALTGAVLASSEQYGYSASPYIDNSTGHLQFPTLTFRFDPGFVLRLDSRYVAEFVGFDSLYIGHTNVVDDDGTGLVLAQAYDVDGINLGLARDFPIQLVGTARPLATTPGPTSPPTADPAGTPTATLPPSDTSSGRGLFCTAGTENATGGGYLTASSLSACERCVEALLVRLGMTPAANQQGLLECTVDPAWGGDAQPGHAFVHARSGDGILADNLASQLTERMHAVANATVLAQAGPEPFRGEVRVFGVCLFWRGGGLAVHHLCCIHSTPPPRRMFFVVCAPLPHADRCLQSDAIQWHVRCTPLGFGLDPRGFRART